MNPKFAHYFVFCSYVIRLAWQFNVRHGDQVTGNFWAGPENYIVTPSPEARNYFLKPWMFRKYDKCSYYCYGHSYEFWQNVCVTRAQIPLEIGFYDANYHNLRPIFATARKNIFGNAVSLVRLPYLCSKIWFKVCCAEFLISWNTK